MSTEYIERKFALSIIDDYVESLGYSPNHSMPHHALKGLSAADVEPVRHGKWIEKRRGAKSPEGYYYWNTPLTHIFVCSECGRQEDKREPYCHCGAKMDEEDCE